MRYLIGFAVSSFGFFLALSAAGFNTWDDYFGPRGAMLFVGVVFVGLGQGISEATRTQHSHGGR